MKASEQNGVQYLSEARSGEDALVRVLRSQIAVTSGRYRSVLEKSPGPDARHSARIADRLESLGAGAHPAMMTIGSWEDMVVARVGS